MADSATSSVEVSTTYLLWSFSNALLFMILLVIIGVAAITALSASSQLNDITKDWSKHRCSPLIMPFAGLFGYI